MKRLLLVRAAYSIVELMVAVGVAGTVLSAVVFGGVAFQRVYALSDDYFRVSEDQTRVLDYIARDVRRALTVNVTDSGHTLELTMPDYVDPGTGDPRMPVVAFALPSFGSARGIVNYGDPLAPVSVRYLRSGLDVVREENGAPRTIARARGPFDLAMVDAGESVITTLSFVPAQSRLDAATATQATMITTKSALRNWRR